ncbi:pseudaminic acid synthase [Tepidibacter sp. Z1-5]|uniref:pseudaminic acid synthase n=1 Tax=Tepidibacter sp. Z1-5 TaxID=3134138 RepID=UPI0030BB42C9
MNEINIGNRLIGDHHDVYIIAEMSANHNKNFNTAVDIIKAAKDAGADCIKLQTYTPDTMTIDCDNEYFKIKDGIWENNTLYNLYKDAYTPWEWQEALKYECDKIGIDFLSTPFDKTAVDFLEEIGVNFYKIASFEVTDIPLIKYIASKKKPIIMSTGNASFLEIKEAVDVIKSINNEQICLLKCSSSYPAIEDDMNLQTIVHLKRKFNTIVGLSDHTIGSVSAICAVALGARIIEKHFCISRDIQTPDSAFSMNYEEFKRMVKDIKAAKKSLGKVNYILSEREEKNLQFRRSIFVVENIKKGEVLTQENIRIIRPSYGIQPKYYEMVIGKKAKIDLKKGTPLTWDVIR